MKNMAQKLLLYYSLKYQGDWNKIYQAVSNKETVDDETLENTFNAFLGDFITIVDEEYPESLKQVYKPPFVLFYEGDINLLKNKNIIAITHTRDSYQIDEATKLLDNEEQLTYMVGGTENSLDKYILSLDKPTIAVIGTALFLNKNHSADLILTELPNNVLQKTSEGFMGRYRIVAGLSHKQLVLSATKHSGSVVLVSLMTNLNKEVLVVPKDITLDYENNRFIYEGATPAFSYEQLI